MHDQTSNVIVLSSKQQIAIAESAAALFLAGQDRTPAQHQALYAAYVSVGGVGKMVELWATLPGVPYRLAQAYSDAVYLYTAAVLNEAPDAVQVRSSQVFKTLLVSGDLEHVEHELKIVAQMLLLPV